jgi:hypothetical protein
VKRAGLAGAREMVDAMCAPNNWLVLARWMLDD